MSMPRNEADQRTIGLVVAAGRGERFGGALPKQYAPLAGSTVLRRSLELLARHPRVDAVRAVIGPGDAELFARCAGGLDLLPPITGGDTRQASVKLGLESLAELEPARVLVHDAARPLASAGLIDRVLDALVVAPAALPVVPVSDTLKRVALGFAVETVPREALGRAQTPQGFRFAEILAAHRAQAGANLTDDAAVAAAAGYAVTAVPGDERNLKITTPEDLRMAELIFARPRAYRVGTGFDVHRLAPGRPLVLCGVAIASELGLAGHSDADVALHALTDAVLGTIGAGDIGTHFPPSDARWKDVASARFLRHALDLLAGRGGRLENADLTLVCERPRIGPHRARMVASLGELLGLDADRVSVKATTSEGLGFTGRGEGIAAQAAVSASFATEEVPNVP